MAGLIRFVCPSAGLSSIPKWHKPFVLFLSFFLVSNMHKFKKILSSGEVAFTFGPRSGTKISTLAATVVFKIKWINPPCNSWVNCRIWWIVPLKNGRKEKNSIHLKALWVENDKTITVKPSLQQAIAKTEFFSNKSSILFLHRFAKHR